MFHNKYATLEVAVSPNVSYYMYQQLYIARYQVSFYTMYANNYFELWPILVSSALKKQGPDSDFWALDLLYRTS